MTDVCRFCKSENISKLMGGNWVDSSPVTSSKRIEPISEYEFHFKEFNLKLCSDCGRITEFDKERLK